MGRLKSTADLPELTEEKIQEYLHLRHPLLTSPKYEAFNMYLYGWESDYLAFSKAGYIWEVEIKISRNDFLADLKNKKDKHRNLMLGMKGQSPVPVPNHFVYVCPKDVIKPEDLEGLPYAGLLWITKTGYFHWQTGVPDIHKGKHPFDDATLAEKFHYAMINMAKRFWNKEVVDISSATKASYEKTIMMYDDMLSERTCEIDELKIENEKLKQKVSTMLGEYGLKAHTIEYKRWHKGPIPQEIQKVLNTPFEKLEGHKWTNRALNIFKQELIENLGEVLQYPEREIFMLRGFGKQCQEETEQTLIALEAKYKTDFYWTMIEKTDTRKAKDWWKHLWEAKKLIVYNQEKNLSETTQKESPNDWWRNKLDDTQRILIWNMYKEKDIDD